MILDVVAAGYPGVLLLGILGFESDYSGVELRGDVSVRGNVGDGGALVLHFGALD